jgi:5''-nucleotidase/2'',3''-cyclic phosphodiesterase and related esterases
MIPAREIAGSNPAYLQPTKLVSFINEVQSYYAEAEISGACAFNNSVQHLEGEITRGSLIGIYNYDSNTVYRLEMKGWQVKEWMEWAVGGSNQYLPYNPETDLTIRHNTSYRSDQFSGVNYTVDLSKPVGERITITAFTGGTGANEAFDMEHIYTVAANDYRTSSGILPLFTDEQIADAGGYPRIAAVDTNRGLAIAPDIISLMAHYIEDVMSGEIDAEDYEENWSFVTSWDPTLREKALELIADGTISYSTNRTVTIADVMDAANVETVDIFSFNDFHGAVDRTSSNPGAARFVAAAKAEMEKSTGETLVLAAGDNYQGSAMSNIMVGEPITEMFKLLGVKYSAVGNHEYDWEPTANMTKWAEDADMTFLAANIFYDSTNDRPTYCEPYAIEELDNGIKIGIIGLATPLTPSLVTASNVDGLTFSDDYATDIAPLVTYLRDTEGCDAVIALTHLGSSMSGGNIGGEVRALIDQVPNLDAVITGHTHATVAGTYKGVPVVQGSSNGRRLSKLAFTFIDGNLLSVVPSNISMPTSTSAAEDPAMKAIIDRLTLELAPLLSEVVGKAPETKPGTVSQYLNDAVYDFIEEGEGESYVFIQNSGGYRTSAWPEQDTFTMNYMYTIMPFDNMIVYMTMTGENLIKVLNGETTLAANITGSPVVSGAYKDGGTWYLTGDTAIADDMTTYNVACNDFMFTGGDNYDFTTATNESYSSTAVRDAMVVVLKSRLTEDLGAVLTSIYTNDGVLMPAFSPTVNTYSITIPYATSLNLDVKASVDTTPVITGNENFTVGSGNTVTITLPVSGGDITYTIDVTVSEASATLAVLSTTDMHGRMWDVNPLDNSSVYNSMLTAATVIAERRAANDFALIIDNGDLIQGTAMTSYNVNAESGVDNPMAIALRYIGYDAFVPGNHEFNYTKTIQNNFYDVLLDTSSTYPGTPVTPIAANILNKGDDTVAAPFVPYIIREYVVGGKTFKVGVLGFENVNVPNWDPEAHYEGMKFSSTGNTEQSFVWEWENRWRDEMEAAGCDIIIISMHTGNGSATFSKENQGRYFIENSTGFDLVIGGHDHSARTAAYTDNAGNTVYYVNGGGSNVTETLIMLSGDGAFSVAPSTNVTITGTSGNRVTPDAGLKTLMQPYYDNAVTFVQEPIGTLAGEWDGIGNFFVNQADGQNLVHEAQLWAAYPIGGADISISGPVNRSSWHPGQLFAADELTADIALKDLYNLYRYDNNLYYVIEMTGAQLKSWMEETAKFYSVNSSGNATGSGFGLDTFYGVSYEVYAGNPVGSRVQNITYKGAPLSDTEILKVAMCSYRLSATADNDEFGWYKATGLTASGDHVLYVGAEAPEFGAVGGSVTLVIGEYIKAMTAEGKQITPPVAISSWAVHPTTYTAPPTGGNSSGGSSSGGGSSNTPTNTPDETLPTITTPEGQPAVENEDGTTTLPGGGTVEMPDGVVIDAPAGTVIDESGTVIIPDDAEAQVVLPGEAATVTISGGSTINTDGSVTVGGDRATVTTASGYTFTLTEDTVIIPNADVPLGFFVSSSMNFADIALSAWHSNAVSYVYALGLMNGTGGNQFSPNMEMNRAMLVTVLWRMSGTPSVNGASSYADVTAGSWYEAAVAWAAGNDIVTGYNDVSFGPDDSITREQLALILYRYCEFMGFDMSYEADLVNFADADSISDWAGVAMAWAYSKGLITGRSATELAPADTATRAEVATVLQRFLEL